MLEHAFQQMSTIIRSPGSVARPLCTVCSLILLSVSIECYLEVKRTSDAPTVQFFKSNKTIMKVFFWGFKEDLIYLFQNKFFCLGYFTYLLL